MMDEVQCEKFIVVGHFLELLFSMNKKNADTEMKLIFYLYKNKLINEEDIKHG
jgi:hypothetical protein